MMSIFSDGYYQDPLLFWTPKGKHAVMDGETISLTPYKSSFFEKVKKQFSFRQDKNLLAVNQRLYHLFKDFSLQSSDIYNTFIQELHHKGPKAYSCLKMSLNSLNATFEKGNKKSTFTLSILRIVNCVRMLFGYEKISFQKYEMIPVEQLENLANIAFQLTEEERKKALFSITTKNNSASNQLTSENIQKLECGVLESLIFKAGENTFSITYKPRNQQFYLSFLSSKTVEDNWLNIGVWRSDVTVLAKDQEQQISKATFWVELEKKKNGSDEIFRKESNGFLPLEPGIEYTIPTKDRDPLTFTLARR